MQIVSDNWKAVQRQQLVNETFLEISVDITDPDAVADATSTDNGGAYISNTAQIVSEVDKNIVPYGTLEENLWLLDGSRRFIPDKEYGDTGYIGNTLSKADGGFDRTPTVDIIFSAVHEPAISGITITWGTAYNEYAEAFKVTAYNGNKVVSELRVDDNTSVKTVVQMNIESYDRIRIEVIKWCLPYHRPRIAEVFIGVNRVYGKSEITDYEHESEVSPIGATLPINRVSFSVDNSNDEYDPNNPKGFAKYIMERQKMRVRYGLKLNDGTIEYIPAGVFYLSEFDAPQNGIEANFVARDLLEFMQGVYLKGLYRPEGISLYDLAVEVFTEANLPLNDDGSVKWVIDESLKSIYTTAPLPVCTLAECLQYIAQAGCCVITYDREGYIRIEHISTEQTDYALTEFNMFSRPEISLQKPLRAVSAKVYNYFSEGATKDLFKGIVSVNGTREIIVTYSDKAVNAVATVVGGTLESAVYYTNACYLKITGEGDVEITITGESLKNTDSNYESIVGSSGETQMIENPLITSTAVASVVNEWVGEWLNNRKIVEIGEWRADPRLDATDIIASKNKFNTQNVRVTSVKYTYTGSFKGTGEGRVI